LFIICFNRTHYDEKEVAPMAPFRAVSLFSNCGAGDLGYFQAGFCFDVMAELDSRRLEVAILNHPKAIGIPGDLTETWTNVLSTFRKLENEEPLALLAACPPCQGMSTANGERGFADDPDAGMKDARNLLVVVIANVARELRPEFIIVENVPAFLSRLVREPNTDRPVTAASLLVSLLGDEYVAFPIMLDLSEYGVPQIRKRVFITLVRKDLRLLTKMAEAKVIPYPAPTHSVNGGRNKPVSLREALKEFGLPSLDAKSEETAVAADVSWLHAVPVWKDRRYSMVAAIPTGTGASAWDNNECPTCGETTKNKDAATCEACGETLLRPVVEGPDGKLRLVNGFRSSSYRRMRPDRPAATITTASGHIGSAFTIHPFENRLLSTLECAYLQTFPKDFNWGDALEKWGHTNVREMIGEAVPPLFTRLHGECLRRLLEGGTPEGLLSQFDKRYLAAKSKLEQSSPAPKLVQSQLPGFQK
jgi:DNA (cytosine-5)-methyltransferase 1